MFELSVACKYLLPRWRQLSVSIISIISVFVIALVVWLIVVFFSVTNGLEKSWVQKLTSLTAPVRITPTDAYYQSYYYLIDTFSDASDYSPKTIHEKLLSDVSDPYNPDLDQELPSYIPAPDLNSNGTVKDLVQLAYQSVQEISNVPGLTAQDFELTGSYIRLNLARHHTSVQDQSIYGSTVQSALNYPTFLGNFEGSNRGFEQTLLPVENRDLNNLLFLMRYDLVDTLASKKRNDNQLKKRLENFFNTVEVSELKTRSMGWIIPSKLLPHNLRWAVNVIVKNDQITRIIVPLETHQQSLQLKELEEQGLKAYSATLVIHDGIKSLQINSEAEKPLSTLVPILLAGDTHFPAQIVRESIDNIQQVDHVRFNTEINVQGSLLKGTIPLRGLDIIAHQKAVDNTVLNPVWVYSYSKDNKVTYVLPKDVDDRQGIVLPKSFRDAGVLIGDRGTLTYMAPTASMIEEQFIPIYVAGFYDPGIIPIGGKYILASSEVTSLIRDSHYQEDRASLTNGINVRFDRIEDAQKVKESLLNAFKQKGIQHYWKVETYQEYEFTKEIINELQSQKNLFMLIAIVIIIVACSNIISMLVILVNDKKMEIGILRSMGATSKNIALIFGIAGALIGMIGSVIGIAAAIFTLSNINTLVKLLGRMQGREMFSSNMYGGILPGELSVEALSFVIFVTICLSLLAGLVPAIKACMLRPSQILRSGVG